MRVEVVTVGDELLLGDVVNGNAAWLGRSLADLGAEVTGSVVVGDELEAITRAVTGALRRADVVIVTGGLGPTYDDLTREALAALAGVDLVRDPHLEERLRVRAARAGRTLVPMALRMAELPEGAGILPNPAGSAPGLRVELPGGVVYALPGVPHEMRAIMTETVLPELSARLGRTRTARRTLRTAGVWESELAARLAPVEAMEGVRLAYLPSPGEVRIRITATGGDAPKLLERAEAMARRLLGPVVYGAEEETLERVVHRLLAERSATVATAESLTGGLLGARLTDMPGSSVTYAGGVVSYATRLKHQLLGVPADLLAAEGAVHPEVAAAMAAGVRDRLGASYGLAVTGVAGPDPQDGRPVGTVFIAVAEPGKANPVVRAPNLPVPESGAQARGPIREMTVVHAFDLLRRILLGVGTGPDAHRWGEDREEAG